MDEDAIDASTWYRDADSDGHGDADVTLAECDQPSGYVSDDTDCDDLEAGSYPGATEYCDDEDNDCDGTVDEDAVDPETWHADADADGFGDADSTDTACDQPSGYVSDATDCDDTDGDEYPGADEVCDGDDDDCDGYVDEATAVDADTWYLDADSDGYGDSSRTQTACDQPSGYVSDATDCDDLEAGSYPGATEYCDDEDNDCDGTVDDSPADPETWYADSDGDGYGDASTTTYSYWSVETTGAYVYDYWPGGASHCDINDNTWRADGGYITDTADLPIGAVYTGDTGGSSEYSYITIGALYVY